MQRNLVPMHENEPNALKKNQNKSEKSNDGWLKRYATRRCPETFYFLRLLQFLRAVTCCSVIERVETLFQISTLIQQLIN